MDAVEYSNISRVEKDHWYNIGKREFVRRWILKAGPSKKDDVLLDCGTGTGLFAKEMEAYCQVLALDSLEPALELLRQRFHPKQVISLAGKDVPLPDESVNYLTALDVVEHIDGRCRCHAGISSAAQARRRLGHHRACKHAFVD